MSRPLVELLRDPEILIILDYLLSRETHLVCHLRVSMWWLKRKKIAPFRTSHVARRMSLRDETGEGNTCTYRTSSDENLLEVVLQ